MNTVDRRTLLASGALALAGAAAQSSPGRGAGRTEADLPGAGDHDPDRRRNRRVSGSPHLLHRAQLCRACDRARLRPDPRAAVLFPEADRRDPERRGRHGRGSSLSVADQELSPRGRAGGGAEIGRHQHRAGAGARSRLWLCARPRHDPARSAERHGGGKEAVGDRQELRPCRGARSDPPGRQSRAFHQGRDLARRQRHGAAELPISTR